MTKNHFHTLGIKPGCTEDDVKKAYRTLAKKFHPDRNKEAGAEEKFKEIAAAYDVLKSKDRREIHEREVHRAKDFTTTENFTFTRNTEHKNNKHEDHSSWSKKFGKESENRYNFKNSTFGSFADEGRDPFGHKSEKKTHQKAKKKQSTKSRPRRPWSHEWTEFDDNDFYDPRPPKANFSFAFKSFVDDLGMSFDAFFFGPETSTGGFGFSTFFDGPDPFEEIFKRRGPQAQARHHKENVAPEKGANGLDEEYLFTSRSSRPETRTSKNSFFTDYDMHEAHCDDSEDDMDSRLFKCTYCEKRMPFSKLSTHEPGCALRRGGKFEDSDDEHDDRPDDIFNGMGSPVEDQYPQKTGDWRQTHEELLRNIRKAKQAAQTSQRRYSSATAATTTQKNEPRAGREDSLASVKCKWCGRTFSHPAAKHHIPFCEKWTKEHGTPLNPAGRTTARDSGSKNQKARQYAKNIPRPRGRSSEDYDSDSPRSPRSHYDNFPNVGVHSKRETLNRPSPTSGTGLNAAFSQRDNITSPGSGSPRCGTPHSRTTNRTAGKFRSSLADDDISFSSRIDDQYGFGLSGSRIKTETRSKVGTCQACRKKYGIRGQVLCNCGVRKT